MPSHLPSSFASAAAGQNPSRDGRGSTSGEWPRQRTTNGTMTFRRSSTTPSNQPPNHMSSAEPMQSPESSTDAPPAPRRYSRDELLSLGNNHVQVDVSTLFTPTWKPGHLNGNNGAPRGWGMGKSAESNALPQEPDICWDSSGAAPLASLREMTAEERDIFSNDVNSAVKPPPQQNKDGNHQPGGLNGRKTSATHGLSLASPTSASRPGTRRRETIDTNPYSAGGLNSPTTASSPWLGRRNTDLKDSTFEEPEDEDMNPNPREGPPTRNPLQPFAGLSRSNTTGSNSGAGGTSSLWGQPSGAAAAMPGMGSFGNFALPGSPAVGEKRAGATRGESRLAHLIPNSSESMSGRAGETSSSTWRPRPRTDTDPFGGGENISGSAVLGGARDTSPPPMTQPNRNSGYDTPVKGSAGDFGMSGLNLLSQNLGNEPLSPSETNPYRSPPGERGDGEEPADRAHGLGLGGHEPQPAFGNSFPRNRAQAAFEGSDRSQTSSVGAKAYPPVGLMGWPTSATPDRERNPFSGPFGSSLFSPVGEVHSPSLGNLSGVFGPATTSSIGRGSKLGSLFPPAMQAQMQNQDNDNLADSVSDLRQVNPLGAIGRNAFSRETDSPVGAGRGAFDDLFGARRPGSTEAAHGSAAATTQPQGFPQSSGTPIGSINDPGARIMVMPDRMRWVYLDPQGEQQGPFTGLEMNDWYKANFFSADLRVKKIEDGDFEPLGQLIRRIGNSREPFLVPQVGIPHGEPGPIAPFSPNATGAIQPPLPGAFPSFGRTLTAQEQNDLERRKQEEQYIMAQQRDMLSNQQRLAARISVPGLQHHSSAQSLHSQPSFGSMTSPITMPQPPIGSIGNAPFFGSQPGHQPIPQTSAGAGFDLFREDDFARLSDDARQQVLAGLGESGASANPQAPIGGPSSDLSFRSRLPGTDQLVNDTDGFRDRLQDFERFRAEHELRMEQQRTTEESAEQAPSTSSPEHFHGEESAAKENLKGSDREHYASQEPESTSLNRQFQQAQAQAVAAAKAGLPMPFPPPQSSTPLPAPAPQRVKSNLPEQYATSSRSGTPDMAPTAVQPPPLAPWANETVASHKGPSIKEIQEAEAKKAAKAEEAMAVMRRVQVEQEAAREREKAAAAASATGLPTTSTWGTASPVGNGASPWAKPAAPGLAAPKAPTQAKDKKKTLADIQAEEEARKAKASKTREAPVQPTGTPSGAGLGKRYADLASRPNAPGFSLPTTPSIGGPPPGAPTAPAAGWSTVGAGGKAKAKIPTGPAAAQPRTTPAVVKPVASPAPVVKPVIKSTNVAKTSEAADEFNKWVQIQLSRGSIGVVDIKFFAQTLMELPADPSIIADAIYANSQTMNGNDFAVEFIRRKKLADKGVVEKQGTDIPAQTGKTGGGWNEVAKKGGHKESNSNGGEAALPAGFKVVPTKKKGKK